MNDRASRLEQAGRGLDPRWDDVQTDLALVGLHRKRRNRRFRLAAVAGLGIAAVLFLVSRSPGTSLPGHQGHPGADSPPVAGSTTFNDGSTMVPLSPGTQSVVVASGASGITVELLQGRTQFQVVPGLPRIFRVRAGGVTAVALGTVFTVERVPGQVGISVDRGRVRVDWVGPSRELASGTEGWFPTSEGGADAAHRPVLTPSDMALPTEPRPVVSRPDAGAPARRPALAPRHASEQAAAETQPTAARSTIDPQLRTNTPSSVQPADAALRLPARVQWQAMARAGAVHEAYDLLRQLSPVAVRNDPEELMLAADSARLSGHPTDALPFLGRVIRDHGADVRAPLAAFTMGRLLLSDLGRPNEAAEAFAKSRLLAPAGVLAEDAMAREVEALSVAGDKKRASEVAHQYLRTYPRGKRTHAVREFGGLE